MEIIVPSETTYTIYGKSGCVYCERAKKALAFNKIEYLAVDCDDYLVENKTAFLDTMRTLAGKEYRTFPMVFYKGEFLGGYVEMKAHLDDNPSASAASHLSFTNDF